MPDDLFSQSGNAAREAAAPLAWRLRPVQLADVIGQEHLTGPGGVLQGLSRARLRSAIFYGPPGTGKTTTARILANAQKMAWVALSAVDTSIADIRQAAERARERWGLEQRGTVLFLDEIHRFNKAQQDVLLPQVEQGTFVLLGATTENPWVALNPALLSRCLLVEFRPLGPADLVRVLERAWSRHQEWWPTGSVEPGVFFEIAWRASGDARLAIGLLERLAVLADARQQDRLTREMVNELSRDSAHYHDRGDRHYDLASALIKSIRGCDPDAALYWFGRLLAGGEDPRFIARRLLVHAAEDVGLADPRALLVAQAAWTALQAVGLPEARIPLAEAVLYLALAPKSHSVVAALAAMDETVARWPGAPVPDDLRDRHYRPDLPAAYRYPHAAAGHFLPDPHLPPELAGRILYQSGELGEEPQLARELPRWRAERAAAAASPEPRG
ncbi:MAG: replication-associated recombination protein A [Thermaerobacter sp.]|nr:replication-associated recombination protein A [Thermaerobacter sp.]